MDLSKAVGVAGLPSPATSDSVGSLETQNKTDHDFSPALHACVMILSFIGLMPIGILILRIMNSVKWHGINQALSAVVALIGVALGVYSGRMFNRSKNFNSAHQIIGSLVMVSMIGQFILGFMHHRIYKRTQLPTKIAPVHVWLGRIIIPVGIVNGFLGFPLALNAKYNWFMAGLILLVLVLLGPLAFCIWRRNNQNKKPALGISQEGGYQSEPWRAQDSDSNINLAPINQPSPYQNPEYNR